MLDRHQTLIRWKEWNSLPFLLVESQQAQVLSLVNRFKWLKTLMVDQLSGPKHSLRWSLDISLPPIKALGKLPTSHLEVVCNNKHITRKQSEDRWNNPSRDKISRKHRRSMHWRHPCTTDWKDWKIKFNQFLRPSFPPYQTYKTLKMVLPSYLASDEAPETYLERQSSFFRDTEPNQSSKEPWGPKIPKEKDGTSPASPKIGVRKPRFPTKKLRQTSHCFPNISISYEVGWIHLCDFNSRGGLDSPVNTGWVVLVGWSDDGLNPDLAAQRPAFWLASGFLSKSLKPHFVLLSSNSHYIQIRCQPSVYMTNKN